MNGSLQGQLRAAIFGSGKLSKLLMAYAATSGIEVVAGLTSDTKKDGKDLGQLLLGQPNGVRVYFDASDAIAQGLDVVLYGGPASSELCELAGDFAASGVDFITSVSMKQGISHDQLELLSRRAMTGGGRVIGTGLVPGFRLDYLPAVLATTVPEPVSVWGRHVSVITTWSDQVLTNEAGIGSLHSCPKQTLFGYLEESFWSLADSIGLEFDNVDRNSTFVHSPEQTWVGSLKVAAGGVIGFSHSIVGLIDGAVRVRLEWTTSRESPSDLPEGTEVLATGPGGEESRLTLNLPRDGYPGTAARMISAVRPLRNLRPGLRAVHELALI